METSMLQSGDIVVADFAGATGIKRRPCVVISTSLYHAKRPDVVLAVVTSQIASASAPTDYALQDWEEANLKSPSAIRIYVATVPQFSVKTIGRLSQRDWAEVRQRVRLALDVE